MDLLISVALMLLIAAGVLTFILLLVLILILAERKVSAYMQDRIGPKRVGPLGSLQTVADTIKLLLKEDIISRSTDRKLFIFAPYLVFVSSFAVFAAIPYGRRLIPSDLNIGIFYIMAISSVVVLGIIMAGWASNSKWALLGAMRSAAQIVSYEIPLGLAILTVIMLAGSLRRQDIVHAQPAGIFSRQNRWFPFDNPFAFLAFFVYFLSSLAEVNRTPFDLPEAESELVAGFHTEYSGMRFALLFLAEYANIFAVSAIAATLFLGGWSGILPGYTFLEGTPGFMIKVSVLVFVIMWLRWTLPRLRVDQLMSVCWKYLIPIAFFNLVGVGVWLLIFG